MKKVSICELDRLEPLIPHYHLHAGVDLVLVRWQNDRQVSVLYGRCLHRGALLSDGHISGDDLICDLHNWDYNYKTGISSYNPAERLKKFASWVEDDQIWIDDDEINAWVIDNPQAYNREAYQGLYQDHHGTSKEPHMCPFKDFRYTSGHQSDIPSEARHLNFLPYRSFNVRNLRKYIRK